MFCKFDVRRKSSVTLVLSWENREIVVRYFVNQAAGSLYKTCVYGLANVKRGYGFNVNVNVNVNVEFKVTLHEQVRYRGTLQY